MLRAGVSHPLAGIAFAGDRGISRVELAIDNVVIAPRLEPVLVRTHGRSGHEWTPTSPGDYEIRVRAYDRNGVAQTDSVPPSFANGATGLHRVAVSVA